MLSSRTLRRQSRSGWVFISCCLSLAFLAACGSNTVKPQVATTNSFAFVTSSGSGTVSAFSVSNSGVLSAVPGGVFMAGAGAEFMAFDSVHKLLFVSNQTANSISAFSVDTATGMLSASPGSPFATGARPVGITVDPMGRFVFVANQAANTISAFTIGAGGMLTAISGSPFAAPNPFGLAVNSAGTFLFANNFPDSQTSDLNSVSAFAISATGSLSPIAGSPFATANGAGGFASGIGLAADPSGKFLFVGDHMAQTVVPFSIGSTGSLTPVSALPAPVPSCSVSCHNNPLRLAVHPNDQFLYVSNVQAGTVSIFKMTNGALSSIAEVPVGQHPFGVALDPAGSFLLVANKVDNTVSAFSIDPSTGMASPVMGSPFSGGLNQPTDIVIVARQ